jgi:3-oxoacyl-[acyl-carrier protein] reductase
MSNPTAIVTGASRGIGRAIALRLSKHYEIIAAARSVRELEAVQREIERAGGHCRVFSVDLADPVATEAALAGLQTDVLVNNAGVGHLKPFLELTPAEWHEMVDVNINALYHVTRSVIPGMIKRRAGHVVFIGSISGRSAFVGGSCYAATKWAVMGMSESLMLEVRDHGVKVSIVNPGSVASEFSERSDPTWMLAPEQVADAVAVVLATPPDVLIHRLEIRPLTPGRKR